LEHECGDESVRPWYRRYICIRRLATTLATRLIRVQSATWRRACEVLASERRSMHSLRPPTQPEPHAPVESVDPQRAREEFRHEVSSLLRHCHQVGRYLGAMASVDCCGLNSQVYRIVHRRPTRAVGQLCISDRNQTGTAGGSSRSDQRCISPEEESSC